MRFLLLAAALLAAAPAASAQTAFGARAGLNVSTFSGDDATNLDPKLGFNGGVFANVPVGMSGLFVQPELGYAQKGAESSNRNEQVDYAEANLLVGYAVPVTETGLTIGAYAGPSLGLKVRESVSTNFLGMTVTADTDRFKTTDLGALLGATVGAGPFAVDARYTLGLQNALESSNQELRNGAFTISGVYTFGR